MGHGVRSQGHLIRTPPKRGSVRQGPQGIKLGVESEVPSGKERFVDGDNKVGAPELMRPVSQRAQVPHICCQES